MRQNRHIQILERLVVTLDHLTATFKHALVAPHLNQTNGSDYIGHVALVPSPDDVVLPCPEFRLRQRILVLPMKAHQLGYPVQFLIPSLSVNLKHATEYAFRLFVQDLFCDLVTKWQIPCQSPTFRGCKILHSMERE